jgi:protein-disulfide isomerase
MSSRLERKERARAARLEAEQRISTQAARRRRLWQLGAVTAVAAAVVVVLVLVNQAGDDDPGGALVGASETREMLEGIPQNGTTLGSRRAPYVLTEFADLQCPFCKDFTVNVLPDVIQRYVRPGRLRLELRTLRFIGEDSTRGARAAQAAADRERMWNFVDLFFRNQGAENSGFANDDFIARVGRAAGVPAATARDAATSPALDAPIQRAERAAEALGVQSTPTFVLGRRPDQGRLLDATQVAGALEQELGR